MTHLLRSVAVLTLGVATAASPLAARAEAPVARSAASVRVAAQPAAQPSVQAPADVRPTRTLRSLLGVHRWFQQYAEGYPVVGGYYAVHEADTGSVRVDDSRVPAERLRLRVPDVAARIAPGTAVRAVTGRAGAAAYLAGEARGLWLLPAAGDRPAHLVWRVRTASGQGVTYHYVDATRGAVLARDRVSADAKGRGRVFNPNPVVALQDEDLVDANDAIDAVPWAGYRIVTLKHLQSTTLRGRWVRITNKDAPNHKNLVFNYRRANDRFEMVNAYYAVDVAQTYLRRLGFTDVNAESQKVKVNAFADDNSYYDPSVDKIAFGTGGVDDAEDIEVIWHEYGHAIQDAQVPGFGTTAEAGAIGEGFGDYLAVTLSQKLSPDTAVAPLACVMDWDATSYTPSAPHCLRRTDGTKVYPTDLDGEVHDDGEIWSRALWDINRGLGRTKANTAIVEAQFSFARGTGFVVAAQLTVDTAQALYGDADAAVVQQAFADRGILPPPT